jgi:hypothetical protein
MRVIVQAPPRPPDHDDLEALIREARARQRRRRLRLAAGAIALVAVGLWAHSIAAGGGAARGAASGAGGTVVSSRRCPPGNLGEVAFVRGGALRLLDLHGCTARTLVAAKVKSLGIRFSHDGRWVAFAGGFVSSRGGAVRRAVGTGIWSPTADVLALQTPKGGLELVRPDGRTRSLLPDGWGVRTDVFSPDGKTLAVSRSLYNGPGSPPATWHQEIWLIDVATGARHELFHLAPKQIAPAVLDGFSPDGRWLLFWEDSYDSSSLAADGLPFLALRVTGGRPVTIARMELAGQTRPTWCGGSLVYGIDHGGRQVTEGDGLAVASPPAWRPRTLLRAGGRTSWTTAACPTSAAAARGGGGLVVAGGPTNGDSPFGKEHRSLWLGSASRASKPAVLRQSVPPRGQTDELPMWSGDGRWILFVRTKPGGVSGRGALYALDPFGGNLVGPIAPLGKTGNYYGAYGWSSQIDWHR